VASYASNAKWWPREASPKPGSSSPSPINAQAKSQISNLESFIKLNCITTPTARLGRSPSSEQRWHDHCEPFPGSDLPGDKFNFAFSILGMRIAGRMGDLISSSLIHLCIASNSSRVSTRAACIKWHSSRCIFFKASIYLCNLNHTD